MKSTQGKAVIYPWDDEIMAEVRQMKADFVSQFDNAEALHRHIKAQEIELEKAGWKFADPVTFREGNMRRQMMENL